jgi:GntR family transcriptional regulator
MLRLRVDSTSTVPPSRQLVEGVLDAIARGALEEGARLPSVRELAAEALVNPNTVAKAYRELQWLGAVRARNGSGVYVAEQGTGIAVDARRSATLEEFARAAESALRAGHTKGELQRMLREFEA